MPNIQSERKTMLIDSILYFEYTRTERYSQLGYSETEFNT